eukprot:SAG25_NODE_2291_length_1749_cov_2.710909_3_plen_52_part_01
MNVMQQIYYQFKSVHTPVGITRTIITYVGHASTLARRMRSRTPPPPPPPPPS